MISKLKDFIRVLSVRHIVFSLMTVISLILFACITLWSDYKINGLADQQAAKRWDKDGGYAQVSCFLSKDAKVDDFKIKSFGKQLEAALKEAAVNPEEGTEKLYIDAYSSQGKINVVSDKGKVDANAIGIGGDFFLFHPMQLVSGSYFSGNDLMKDSVILDEEAAWQLFGSSDIAGQSVLIGNVPHYVTGVIKREKGRFAENAGLSSTVVYLSDDSLTKYGTSEGISTYELVAPNPVKGFVYKVAKEKFGVDEKMMLAVENSSRFSLEAQFKILTEFGTRSMQNAAVHFPYWENIARGWEDVKGIIFIFQIVLLIIPFTIIITFLIIKWKNRSFTWKDVGQFIIETKDHAVEKVRGEGKKWKHF